jgi:hypothetical protein
MSKAQVVQTVQTLNVSSILSLFNAQGLYSIGYALLFGSCKFMVCRLEENVNDYADCDYLSCLGDVLWRSVLGLDRYPYSGSRMVGLLTIHPTHLTRCDCIQDPSYVTIILSSCPARP